MQPHRSAEESVSKSITPTTLRPAPDHTPLTLVKQHGEVSRDAVTVYIAGTPVADILEQGQRVSTARVESDGVRILGDVTDFLATASSEQRALIGGIDGPFLAAACTALVYVSKLGATVARRKKVRKDREKAATSLAQQQMTDGRARRDLYCANLLTLCGGDEVREARVRAAQSAAETPAELADAYDKVADEAQEIQTSFRAEKRACFVDDAWIARVRAEAKTLRKSTTPGVAAKHGEPIGELAWWEGACVWFLKTAVAVFGRAHTVDARVPKLQARALRSVLTPSRMRKRAKKSAPKGNDAPR